MTSYDYLALGVIEAVKKSGAVKKCVIFGEKKATFLFIFAHNTTYYRSQLNSLQEYKKSYPLTRYKNVFSNT